MVSNKTFGFLFHNSQLFPDYLLLKIIDYLLFENKCELTNNFVTTYYFKITFPKTHNCLIQL